MHPTRSEEIHARGFMLMLGGPDGTHKWSIALVRPYYDGMLLPLRPVAGHTTQHSYKGT